MISIAVQAGGESHRMGEDKALLPFLGESMLARVMKRVNPLGDELFVTTNHPERFLDFGVPMIQDELPGKGALGGLLTALSAAQFSTVIVVACDMPFVNPEILADASDQLHAQQVDVVIPLTEKGYEPLHAVYRRETCLPAVRAALEAGERRLISWFPSVKVIQIDKHDLIKFDPARIAFWNVNTPEDLHKAEELALELGE
jgi:molybdopterin-guanine dinucleotide biosynthesis protein A